MATKTTRKKTTRKAAEKVTILELENLVAGMNNGLGSHFYVRPAGRKACLALIDDDGFTTISDVMSTRELKNWLSAFSYGLSYRTTASDDAPADDA